METIDIVKRRWQEDDLFKALYLYVFARQRPYSCADIKEWLKTQGPHIQQESLPPGHLNLDCRGVELDGMFFGDQFLNYVLDSGSAQRAIFLKTNLQGGSAQNTNFSESRFVLTQMSPFYAAEATFDDCVFVNTYLSGLGVRNPATGEVSHRGATSDFSKCSFRRATFFEVDMERCDLKDCDFTDSFFYRCSFNNSDMTGAIFLNCVFEECSFEDAWISDTKENRELFPRGKTIQIDRIRWIPPLS